MIMHPIVVVKPSKQSLIQQGHPWLFEKAILRQDKTCRTGELVRVLSATDEALGLGIYNEHSLYRVRMLSRASEQLNQATLSDIIIHRLRQAYESRRCLQLPNAQTNAFRLLNSEADGLSGLIIDQFDTLLVVAASAFWVQAHQAIVCEAIRTVFPQMEILWMPQKKPLLQDGWVCGEIELVERHLTVKEHDVLFKIDFSSAQKTGLFLDQRDNHQRLATLTKGLRVLDLYTYTGGFALHAAKAGAASVVAVDSSGPAILRAQENAALNQLSQIEFVKADARDYLQQAGAFDVVILDPPKLMPSKKNQIQAKNYYRFLHKELFKAMRPNTVVMTCNCSSALTARAFAELVYLQAVSVNKSLKVMGQYGPSSCHPVLPVFAEGNYLTAVLGVVC